MTVRHFEDIDTLYVAFRHGSVARDRAEVAGYGCERVQA